MANEQEHECSICGAPAVEVFGDGHARCAGHALGDPLVNWWEDENTPDGSYAEYLHRAEIGRRMLDIPGYGHD